MVTLYQRFKMIKELPVFWLGFLGGFIIEFYSYLHVIRAKQRRRITEVQTEHDEPIEDDEYNEGRQQRQPEVRERDEVIRLFKPLKIICYLFFAFLGGIMADLINPQISFFGFYIGLTSAGFLNRFY